MALSIAAIVIGVALLAWASDQFVIGAARIAVLRRVRPLVVGVVIVGFGTSSPELVVSALAALRAQPEIAVGNVVGSNLANLGLILGIGVLILPLAVASETVRREAPLTVGGAALFAILVQSGISTVEGLVLVGAMAVVVAVVVRRRPSDPLGGEAVELVGAEAQLGREVIHTLRGLVATLGAAQLLLWGAVDLAERGGLSEGFVGATLVAVGTSLPELVTVIQSARRGEGDLVVGNLLGSCLFNGLAIAGIVGLTGSGELDAPALTGFAAIAAVVQAALVWGLMRTGRRMTRTEGGLLLISYAVLVPFLSGG